jgi:hypothetical protein
VKFKRYYVPAQSTEMNNEGFAGSLATGDMV